MTTSADSGLENDSRSRLKHGLGEKYAAFSADRMAFVSVIFLVAVGILVLLAPVLNIQDPYEAVKSMRNAPPGTAGFLLGADGHGRDVLSRLIWGGRVSLLIGILPTVSAMVISLFLGIVAAYWGGWFDILIMRSLDVLFAFPLVLLAIAIAGVMEPGIVTEILAITIILIPHISRLVRTSTLSVIAQPYIEAARAGGAGSTTLIFRFILPNMIAPVIVYATTLIGLMIVVGSGLSFLGLGVQPPVADWGEMVSEGRVVLRKAPHVTLFPGFAILFVSLAFNFVGDGLQNVLNPKSAKK